VTTPEGGEAIVEAAVGSFGRLDAVVSNAGIFHTAPFDELAIDDWRRMIDVHVHGGFFLSQPAYRVMKAQGYGRFVLIASSAGLFGQPNSAHYAAAKSAVVGLTNVIAIEGAECGVLANSVLPFGHSRMVTETIGEVPEDSEFLNAIDPELVVPIVVYLASSACRLTHYNFSACAGRFARVFVGLAEGWLSEPGTKPTAEDIEAHLTEVEASDTFTIPASIFDEITEIISRRGLTS
jgi:NAD(P)-dependent dehydrogenase (short-subunit alcohol dehydrogenase family)